MTSQTQISGGPSKFDLMVSLFEGNKTPRKTIRFKVDSGRRNPVGPRNSEESAIIHSDMDVGITAVEQEDGSGESWMFQGYVVSTFRPGRIQGYYSTKTRTGWFKRFA